MSVVRHKILAVVIVCALAATATATATSKAQQTIGVSKSQAAWIVVGVVAIVAAVGVGVYFAVRHGHSLTGCTVAGPNGLELQNKGDQQTYALIGAVDSLKPGEHIRVDGKKVKKSAGPTPQFTVEKLSKDYGACQLKPASP